MRPSLRGQFGHAVERYSSYRVPLLPLAFLCCLFAQSQVLPKADTLPLGGNSAHSLTRESDILSDRIRLGAMEAEHTFSTTTRSGQTLRWATDRRARLHG
jgi:hypothetical protein